MACGSGTLHDPGNETADAGRHGFPDSCGIGVSACYGIVDCICEAGKDKCIKCRFIFKPNEWLDTCRNCSGSDSTSHTALLCN